MTEDKTNGERGKIDFNNHDENIVVYGSKIVYSNKSLLSCLVYVENNHKRLEMKIIKRELGVE